MTLTSRVFWALDYHQVKLFNAVSQSQGSCESCVINFGSAHDYKFATAVTDPLSEKQVQGGFIVNIKNEDGLINISNGSAHDPHRTIKDDSRPSWQTR